MFTKKVKLRFFLLLLSIILASFVVFFIMRSLEDNVVYFYSPSEVYKKSDILVYFFSRFYREKKATNNAANIRANPTSDFLKNGPNKLSKNCSKSMLIFNSIHCFRIFEITQVLLF